MPRRTALAFAIAVTGFLANAAGATGASPALAVADFTANNTSGSDAVVLTDLVRAAVIADGTYTVVDKNNMDKVLAGQAIPKSGCTSEDCAVKLGKILNVQKMIVGTYSLLGTERFLTARLVDVESGRIEHSATRKGFDNRDADVAAQALVSQLFGHGEPAGAPVPAPPDSHPVAAGAAPPNLGISYGAVVPAVAKRLQLAQGTGWVIQGVLAGSSAARADLRPRDIILAVDGKPLFDNHGIQNAVHQHARGDVIQVEVDRNGERLTVPVTLGGPPVSFEAGLPGSWAEWRGMAVMGLTQEVAQRIGARNTNGLVVTGLTPAGPAFNAGVQLGDVLDAIEDQPVTNIGAFMEVSGRRNALTSITMTMERRGSPIQVVILLPAKAVKKK
jgi:hypothetical protein